MIKHLACQMDGNRRWATVRGLDKNQGHTQGIETVKIVTEFCLEKKIPYLSLYTLSSENLNRSEQEKSHIFGLMLQNFQEGSALLQDCIKNGVRIRFIGDRALVPVFLLPLCDRVEQQTAHLTSLNLNFMFCYGARQDIVSGVKKVARAFAAGILSVQDLEKLSVDSFKNYLWMGDMPDPDLVIRAGAVVRLSNFMLYQAAYSEWYFTHRLWPEMTKEDFQAALDDFAQRQRRFGV